MNAGQAGYLAEYMVVVSFRTKWRVMAVAVVMAVPRPEIVFSRCFVMLLVLVLLFLLLVQH